MDAIYLAVNGQSKGPYTLAQVRESLAKSEISRETPAWYEGLAEWTTLGAVLDSAGVPAGVPPPAPGHGVMVAPAASVAAGGFTVDQLREIARGQNLLMWAVAANIAGNVTLRVLSDQGLLIILPIAVAILAFMFYSLSRLTSAMRYSTVAIVFLCLAMFIPCVSLIILVILSGQASKVLKAAGVRVGLMGARADDIKG